MTKEKVLLRLKDLMTHISQMDCENQSFIFSEDALKDTQKSLETAIKAIETIDKLQKSCDRYISDGVGYYGYIKLGIAKRIAEEFINDN